MPTSLNTHILIKYIKQNKKLQEIKTSLVWFEAETKLEILKPRLITLEESKKPDLFDKIEINPAPTIADIIDNAEMLFGETRHFYHTANIIGRCQDNKSIEDISEYIINNIK